MLAVLAGCGGGGDAALQTVPSTPYTPSDDVVTCKPGADVTGVWKAIANNGTYIPDSTYLTFFSYNQPSINSTGLVVFRGRAKSATGDSGGSGGSGGAMARGVFAVDACLSGPKIYTVADTNTAVPAPNSTGATYNEFPSIPRIDIDSGVLATRGQSTPVWTLADGTKVGTSGIYVEMPQGFMTGVGLLGNLSDFSYMQVPNASTSGVKFDQFPGSPTVTQGHYVAFKGNYTDGSTSKTGIYYRDLNIDGSAVHVIADTNMTIPGTSTTFGSTAPPSAAGGQVAFVGLDNEDAPTAGGIYLAAVADRPALTALVQIGSTVVPDAAGNPLTGNPTFSQLGEGLSFDGRYISFWGAWGTQDPNNMRQVTLTCPTDGNDGMRAACLEQYPSGQTQKAVAIDQGIFVYDLQTGKVTMAARAGATEMFQDFLYWVFSGHGATGGSGSGTSGPTDAEPPRWRSSAFTAVDSERGVLFKGSLSSAGGATPPASGIYGAAYTGGAPGAVFKLVEVGDDMTAIDHAAPAGSAVTALGIEREALRRGWLTLTASSLDPAGESWGGVYATYFPSAFRVNGAVVPGAMPTLGLGG